MAIRSLPWTLDFGSQIQNGATQFDFSLAPLIPRGVGAVRVLGWHMKGSALPPAVKVSFSSDSSNTVSAFYSRAAAQYTATPARLIQNGVLLQPNTSLTEEDHEFQVPVLVIDGLQAGLQALRVSVTDYDGAAVSIDNSCVLRLEVVVNYAAAAYPDPGRHFSTDNYFMTSGQRPNQS